MKCPEVYAWLLISRTTCTPPKEVRRHLQACPKCQARRTRLLLLDEELAQPPVVVPNPETKTRFLARLEQFAPARSPAASKAPWHRWGAVAVGLAAALLLAVGLIWLTSSPTDKNVAGKQESLAKAEGPAARAAEEELVARFVAHNVHFAGAFQTSEQAALMNAMALDLRGEAVRLAMKGQPDDLPLLATLYELVVRRGLVGRLRQLPVKQRQELLPVFLRQLQETESSVDLASRDRSLVVSDYLLPMRTTAQETALLLQNDEQLVSADVEQLPAFAGGAGTPHALLALLVTQNLLLAEESDPLRRAYYCNDLADQLALASLLASARGDGERAARLGKHLSNVVDRGVSANLTRLQKESPQDPRLRDLEDVIRSARRTVEAMEKTFPAAGSGEPRVSQTKDLEKSLKELEKALREVTKEKKEGAANRGEHGADDNDLKGVVRSFDVAKRLLVLLVKEKGREIEKTLQAPADVKIKGGPKGATLDDLKPGMALEAKVRDGSVIVELKFEGKDK